MTATHSSRSIAALATAIACLALVANPAAAVVHDVEITNGPTLLTKVGVSEWLNFSGFCQYATLTADLTGTSISVTAMGSSDTPAFSTGTLLTVLTRSPSGNSPGVLGVGTTHTITSLRIGVVATIYNTLGCVPTGTPVCTVAFILSLSGTSTSVTPSQTLTLSGSSVGSVVSFPTCTAGPTQLLGTTAFTTLTAHLTT